MKTYTSILIVLVAASVVSASGCGGNIYVEGPLTLTLPGDSPVGNTCEWNLQTRDDRVLMFTIANSAAEQQLLQSLNIYDASSPTSKSILSEKFATENEGSEKNFFSTGPVALLQFVPGLTKISELRVKVQPAADCPLNIGIQSSCARILNDGSCHCVSWVARDWTMSRDFCQSKGMELVSIETRTEELGLENAWTNADLSVGYWTSGSEDGHLGCWAWTATGRALNYTNWSFGQPSGEGQNYLMKNVFNTSLWDDNWSVRTNYAICESSP